MNENMEQFFVLMLDIIGAGIGVAMFCGIFVGSSSLLAILISNLLMELM
ncbi:hypothetical protein MKC54_09705 [[Clostridium] innocuum]|nr:hypothetical protein [[Clostridium] innocuum]MCR0577161.1 hypothetical protein [[Clostridium] innocuum]